jgi:hypothetical protein
MPRRWREGPQAVEGGDERLGPGPVAREPELGAPPGANEPSGHVEQPVAQPLGLGQAMLTLEIERLRPGEEVLGDQHQLEPDLVVLEGVEGEVLEARVLGAADAVLDAGPAAVGELERGDVRVRLVGDEAREAVAVGVLKAQLGTGMGRSRRGRGPAASSQGAAPARRSAETRPEACPRRR